MHCRFLQPRFWEHKKSRDRTLESGGKELVDFGGTLVSAGGMRRYAGITCIFVGGQIYPGEEIQDGGVGECRLDTCL